MDDDAMSTRPRSHDADQETMLEAAVSVLTAAARLGRPVLERTEDYDEPWVESVMQGTGQIDWAEFVGRALAGAAANLGGVTAALGNVPRHSDHDALVQLINTAVGGSAPTRLWSHRRDPLAITLCVDLILRAFPGLHESYAAAQEEIADRRAQSDRAAPPVEYDEHVWFYERTAHGEFVPLDPAAPAWTWEVFRAQPRRGFSARPENVAIAEANLRAGTPHPSIPGCLVWERTSLRVYIFKSRAAAKKLWREEDAWSARVGAYGNLHRRLAHQQEREWAEYGAKLKAQVQQLAAGVDGLTVPVNVVIDAGCYEGHWAPQFVPRLIPGSLEAQLVAAAVARTPTPADLPGSPLTRLGDDPRTVWPDI